MKRKVVNIDQEKCNGCGLCVPNCAEGAIQIIDGKARLLGDLFCDGLGACLGHCPLDAISIEEREAEPYDERKVMENIVEQGPAVIKAHIKHMKDHNEMQYYRQAIEYLKENNIDIDLEEIDGEEKKMNSNSGGGCPGSRAMNFSAEQKAKEESGSRDSHLTHWPIQLHLISPAAPHYKNADLLLAADCVAFSMGDFHKDYLKDKKLTIACPKLDDGQEMYVEKLASLIDDAKINTLTVMIMQVPCCSGLLRVAKAATEKAERKVPIKAVVVGIQGEILKEEWV
ncbi:4Fe-4S binding protein [Chitinispirillales bacterium ANBcel5]|uniref:ATP-binding protein n=1 Tax=Cellulosispirillum alkaliphilum TaxID=3039283 RepID=UPI002A55E21B|nr:4Fe-4S binding protein [Chitinispirillales bacterium ANBcel5]